MKELNLLIVIAFFCVRAFSQTGNIEGKIVDAKNGLPLAGVSVMVKGYQTGTSSDIEGRYFLQVTAGKLSLIYSYGTTKMEINDILAEAGKVTVQDIAFEMKSKTEDAVVITAVRSSRKETQASLLAFQKNTNTVASVISAEAIRRSPDKTSSEVLKRVPGSSVQEGKYLVVRGLADRYNQAMLNGVLMNSTEPDRKTFSFDILPASMIDNIVINKAFVPELPGEWAGGLVQVQTKDIPSKNFFNIQLGTGFNTNTIGHDFYKYRGGKTDWLGFDDGTRALPADLPTKHNFLLQSPETKAGYAKELKDVWTNDGSNYSGLQLLNVSFLANGGFKYKLNHKTTLSAILGVNYNASRKRIPNQSAIYTFSGLNPNMENQFDNEKYNNDLIAGAIGNITLNIGKNHKISWKNLLNVNTANYLTERTGLEDGGIDSIKATELAFKANTLFNTVLSGDHKLGFQNLKLHWYGSFNILDQYIPDQRRIQSKVNDPLHPELIINLSANSQKSGSRFWSTLSDYVYVAGGDLSRDFKIKGLTQTIKGGYLFQVKDRLFDARPFAIYLTTANPSLTALSADQAFAPENFGNGNFYFNELFSDNYRYIANTILNAGFLQFDNQFSNKIRVVWGLRVEDYDQVLGSMKKSDPRYIHSVKTDLLPGFNFTYKLNHKTNIRLSASQTVIRPEFRELSSFAFYDFDLGATTTGSPLLERTKVTNLDLRYELYQRAGETFNVGIFYKDFKKPIEAIFNASSGGASTYNYLNAPNAKSYGAELEFRKKLDMWQELKNFTVHGNLSYIYNRVQDDVHHLDRPMQGQSPYLINFSLQYDLEKPGIAATILYNQIGRRILYVGAANSVGGETPPIWENPRPLIDLQIAKKILAGRGELKLNVSDLLHKDALFYYSNSYKFNKGTDVLSIRRNYGTNYSFSFNYNF